MYEDIDLWRDAVANPESVVTTLSLEEQVDTHGIIVIRYKPHNLFEYRTRICRGHFYKALDDYNVQVLRRVGWDLGVVRVAIWLMQERILDIESRISDKSIKQKELTLQTLNKLKFKLWQLQQITTSP